MNEPCTNTSEGIQPARRWKNLTRLQRRVVGVLVEKSKTTPSSYPMTLNAIKVASNQKSNRSPQMDLEEEDVEDTLEELRQMGAVTEVHSGSRTLKYKHELYDWFDVDKAGLAVLAELLLRGEQSLGDLRARVARMENISGLDALKPIVAGLLEKELMVEITPPGRGQIVTHNLYQTEELDRIRSRVGGGAAVGSDAIQSRHEVPGESPSQELSHRMEQLEFQIEELRSTVSDLQNEIRELKAN